MSYSPMMQQYLHIKQDYQNHILMFRMGDFYEMFFTDAVTAAKDLEITLTARDGGGEKVPMCGVPHHAVQSYIARLIEKGHRVVICEQTEDPKLAKGLVKREVTRVITPGTVMEGQCLEDKNNNYLAAILTDDQSSALAYTDISTGLFRVTQFSGEQRESQLVDELYRLQPAELLLPLSLSEVIAGSLGNLVVGLLTPLGDEDFSYASGKDMIRFYFGEVSCKNDIENSPIGLRAAGAILKYLHTTQQRSLRQIEAPKLYRTDQYMKLDLVSRRNLELTTALKDGGRFGTLIWALDYTDTAMGGRLLKQWIQQPLMNIELINLRLDAVEELHSNLLLRLGLKEALKKVYDLERLIGRAAFGSANARDLSALCKSLGLLPGIKQLLKETKPALLRSLEKNIDEIAEINQLLNRAIEDDPPLSLREGGIIKDGYHAQVDDLREASRNGKNWLAQLEAEERSKTGIKSLKVGFNKVFGYYLEVTKSNLAQVPDYFIRKQTLVNGERFITEQLKEYENMIVDAEDKLMQLEYQLFDEVRQKITEELARIKVTANSLGILDVLVSLAEAAMRNNLARPSVYNTKKIAITEGRHVVVEKVLKTGNFVPNDTLLDEDCSFMLLTGPNMAGKSTYMRQVALIVLMAQIGSFVPAKKADIGLVDCILTRIGASDDLAGGRSTFMVEMSECREIIVNATDKSLIIMDEVGRGTSTYDGISIARALVEYIHDVLGTRTLFSTHYHELTDLDSLPGVVNYTVSVHEEQEKIVFLRKVLPGKVDQSYGIQVAKLVGLPDEVLKRAQYILRQMETKESLDNPRVLVAEAGSSFITRSKADPRGQLLIDALAEINALEITPLDALNIIFKLKEMLAMTSENPEFSAPQ